VPFLGGIVANALLEEFHFALVSGHYRNHFSMGRRSTLIKSKGKSNHTREPSQGNPVSPKNTPYSWDILPAYNHSNEHHQPFGKRGIRRRSAPCMDIVLEATREGGQAAVA